MEVIKITPKLEFDVIYSDGSKRRVTEGILFEAEANGSMIFHNGTDRPEVLLSAAETALVALSGIGPGLEALAYGMALDEAPSAALKRLAKAASDVMYLYRAEKQSCFRLGQKDMQASVMDMLLDTAAKMPANGMVGPTLRIAADMVKNMEVP